MRTRRHASSSDPMPLNPTHAQRMTDTRHRGAQRKNSGEKRVVQRETSHTPVLLEETLTALAVQPHDTVLDATLGGAGHAKRIVAQLSRKGTFVGIDADQAAVERAQNLLTGTQAALHLIRGNFRHLGELLPQHGVTSLDKALFDLGWSSFQLTDGRGFSFQRDEPLIMTYDSHGSETITAEVIVNTWEEQSLVDILEGWGEERFAKRIAQGIIEARKEKSIQTAVQLAEIVKASVPHFYRHGALHPATKTFQALRIAVNDELGALSEGLRAAWLLLKPQGVLAVISFHSIEDRVVKRQMLEWSREGALRITKSPIVPDEVEIRQNPRSRSAKLRVIQKK